MLLQSQAMTTAGPWSLRMAPSTEQYIRQSTPHRYVDGEGRQLYTSSHQQLQTSGTTVKSVPEYRGAVYHGGVAGYTASQPVVSEAPRYYSTGGGAVSEYVSLGAVSQPPTSAYAPAGIASRPQVVRFEAARPATAPVRVHTPAATAVAPSFMRHHVVDPAVHHPATMQHQVVIAADGTRHVQVRHPETTPHGLAPHHQQHRVIEHAPRQHVVTHATAPSPARVVVHQRLDAAAHHPHVALAPQPAVAAHMHAAEAQQYAQLQQAAWWNYYMAMYSASAAAAAPAKPAAKPAAAKPAPVVVETIELLNPKIKVTVGNYERVGGKLVEHGIPSQGNRKLTSVGAVRAEVR